VPVGDDFDGASGAAVDALSLATQKPSFNVDQASLAEVLAGEVGQLTPEEPVVELGVARADEERP